MQDCSKVSVPSYSDVKRKGDQMWRDNRGDVVLLVVDSADDGQQRLLDSCLELSVAPGSHCRKSKGGRLQEREGLQMSKNSSPTLSLSIGRSTKQAM